MLYGPACYFNRYGTVSEQQENKPVLIYAHTLDLMERNYKRMQSDHASCENHAFVRDHELGCFLPQDGTRQNNSCPQNSHEPWSKGKSCLWRFGYKIADPCN